ncbi:MAG TPA: hypothetical protein VLV78_11965 [Thermoanaerobaculia bacterium]|nr:hypothetical protein [Thermoanaerobaculia bacterium]
MTWSGLNTFARRFAANGQATSPAITLVPAIDIMSSLTFPLESAWNGRHLVVVWMQPAFAFTPACVVARRFTSDGAPAAPQKNLGCDNVPPGL